MFFLYSNSARFLWKSMDVSIKESQPEVIAVWKIGQMLWTRDYAGVYEAIRSFNWSPQIQPLVAAFEGSSFFTFLIIIIIFFTVILFII